MIIYNQLEKLASYFKRNRIEIKINQTKDIQSFKTLELNLNNNNFIIYIDDEYNDINEANPLMCLFLILRELEIYKDSTDYLDWFKQLGVNANDEKLRQYYFTLGTSYKKIENILGEVDSCISSLDYQLNTGVIQKLRGL